MLQNSLKLSPVMKHIAMCIVTLTGMQPFLVPYS